MRTAAILLLCLATCTVSFNVPAPVDVFMPLLEPQVLQYRIPALVRTGKGTLIAFAEARTDPLVDCAYKWITARRSVDNGTTWGPPIDVAGASNKSLATGNPQVVFHAASGRVVLAFGAKILPPSKFVYCSPGDGVFVVDDGGTDGEKWGVPRNISSMLGGLAEWGALIPGPGTGTVMTSASNYTGRIIFSGSVGAYGRDVAFYSGTLLS